MMSSETRTDHGTDTPRPGQFLDAGVVRATAALTNIVLVAAGALLILRPAAGLILITIQSAVFAVAAHRPRRHPYRLLARLIRPAFPAADPEHELPVRFAAKVGLGFTGLALLAALAGFQPAAVVLTLSCAGAAGLNAYGNICLACRAYPRLRLLSASVTRMVRSTD